MTQRFFRRAILLGVALAPLPFAMVGAASAQDIPAAMRGTWAQEAAFCTTPESDGRIAISAREIQFFASSCGVKKLRNLGNGRWRADVTCVESGESDDLTLDLRLVAPQRLSLRRDTDPPETLFYCVGNPRVR